MNTYRVTWLSYPYFTGVYQATTRGQARWLFVQALRNAWGEHQIPFTIRLSIRKEQS